MATAAVLESEPGPEQRTAVRGSGVGRFTIAVTVGGLVVAVPYLWLLTDLWNKSPTLFRTVIANHSLSNFYDLQARAMFQGHLYVPKGSLGQEAWIHGGRQFTYFGLFPSILRMPVLLFTHSLDGRLTAPSMLLAWLVTGLFSSLLLWRVRVLVRGPVSIGWAEAATHGLFVATILGGSVLMNLAASPWVYSEDIAWSVALSVASLFALLGVLEGPTWPRVVVAGALILATSLNRGSSGYGCVLGALLAAAWFGLGAGGDRNRRWWWPVLIAGMVPLVVASAVSWAKFGVPFGYPLHDQVYYQDYLSKIPGSYFSFRYVPSTVAAYFAGTGMHLSPVFPFITLPLFPARAVGGVPLFGTQEVATVPGSMLLLLMLSLWGLVAVFRRRTVAGFRLVAIPVIAAAAPGGLILIFGFLDERFLGDFLPFLIVASATGVVAMWRWLTDSRRRVQAVAVGIVALLAVFGVAANTAMASTPTGWWSTTQVRNFVEAEKSLGDLTGYPLSHYVWRGAKLPAAAPRDQLFVLRNCAGLYLYAPNGIRTWLKVEGRHSRLCRSLIQRS
jgi:hypothetical protein